MNFLYNLYQKIFSKEKNINEKKEKNIDEKKENESIYNYWIY